VVVDLDIRANKYRNDVPVVTVEVIEDSTGKFQAGDVAEIWCHTTVLRNEMIKARPEKGDEITITYLGWDKSETYKRHKVRGGQGSPFSWDKLEQDGDFGATDEDDEDVPF